MNKNKVRLFTYGKQSLNYSCQSRITKSREHYNYLVALFFSFCLLNLLLFIVNLIVFVCLRILNYYNGGTANNIIDPNPERKWIYKKAGKLKLKISSPKRQTLNLNHAQIYLRLIYKT